MRQKFIVYQNSHDYKMHAIPATDLLLKTKPEIVTEGYSMTLSRTTPKRAINAALARGFAENLDSRLSVSQGLHANYAAFVSYSMQKLGEIVSQRSALRKFLPDSN